MSLRYAVPTDRIAARTIDGEAVVINLESGVYFGFNASATQLWGLLEEGPRGSDTLADCLAAAYGADVSEVAGDVRFFLDALAREGIIEVSELEETVGAVVSGDGEYIAPMAERFDKLDELMLSGE